MTTLTDQGRVRAGAADKHLQERRGQGLHGRSWGLHWFVKCDCLFFLLVVVGYFCCCLFIFYVFFGVLSSW